jgi:hypothetical protein
MSDRYLLPGAVGLGLRVLEQLLLRERRRRERAGER